MKEGDTISEYFARVMVVVIMRNLGEEMSDAKRVEMIVRTLVEEFTFVVCGIEESNVIKDHAVKVGGRWNSSGGREAKGEEDTKWSAGYVFDEKKKWSWENDQQDFVLHMGSEDEERAYNMQSMVENIDGNELLIDAGDEELISLSTVSIGEKESKEISGEQREICGPEPAAIIGSQPKGIVSGSLQQEKIETSQVTGSSSQIGRSKHKPVWTKDYGCDGMEAIIEEDGEELIAMFVIEDDPKKLVGSLRYLTATRSDLIYSVNLVSRYMENPKEQHLLAAKRILRYVQGTIGFGIQYKRGEEERLVGYVDNDYAGDEDDRRSTSGYTFILGDGAVSWTSKKQPIVTLSTTEVEFVTAANGACQAVWLRNMLAEIGFDQGSGTVLYCDNSSTIKLSKNPVLHGRSKHIHVRYHFLRELVNDGVIKLEYCRTQEQLSDIMTKPVKLEVFEKLRGKMGVGLKEE